MTRKFLGSRAHQLIGAASMQTTAGAEQKLVFTLRVV